MGCCFQSQSNQIELASSISLDNMRNDQIDKKPMSDWHRGHVLEWFDNDNNKALQQLKPVFHQHQISGLTLETLTKDQLKNELNINEEALCDLFLVQRDKYKHKKNTHNNTHIQSTHSLTQSISKSIDIKIKKKSVEITESSINITDLYNILNQFNMNSIKTKIIDLRHINLFLNKHILTSININSSENDQIVNLTDVLITDTNDKVKFYEHLQSFKSETKLIIIYNESNNENKLFKTNLQKYLYTNYGINKYMFLNNSFDNFYEKYPFLCYDKLDNKEEKSYQNAETIEKRYPTEVIDNKLYVGDWKQSECFEMLNNLKITHILNVSDIKHEFNKLNIEYKHIIMKDSINENILDGNLQNAIKWIDNCLYDNENRILIHCMEGISRSATVVIGYLMNKNKWNFNVAYQYLHKIRPDICPNDGFKTQLMQFEKQIIV